MRTGAAADEIDEEAMPERIGAYRITELIGRGGMGSVYRGERETGDFAHVVAIKVIKPGLLSESLVERFLRERQLLAGCRIRTSPSSTMAAESATARPIS